MATACVDKSVFFANHYLTNIKAVFYFQLSGYGQKKAISGPHEP